MCVCAKGDSEGGRGLLGPMRAMRAERWIRSRVRETGLLFRLAHDVVDGRADLGVGQVHAATLRRHEAFVALEALDRMHVQSVVAFCDARTPCLDVAERRRTRVARRS